MKYYKIADAVIALDGFNYEYVQKRMSEYEIEQAENIDMTVKFSLGDVPSPNGEKIAVANNFREYYLDGETFSIHDFLNDEFGYSAAIVSDIKTSQAHCYLKDIQPLGGSPADIR